MNSLPARAALEFLALPGVVGFLVPWLMLDRRFAGRVFQPSGFVLLAPGLILLVWCVAAFYHVGRGTLAPWDPPRALVVTGVYGLSRNPMYVAVVLVLCGWALGFRARPLVIYAAVVAVAFHFRVVFFEEPWLVRRYGDEWIRYKARVPRWLGIRG